MFALVNRSHSATAKHTNQLIGANFFEHVVVVALKGAGVSSDHPKEAAISNYCRLGQTRWETLRWSPLRALSQTFCNRCPTNVRFAMPPPLPHPLQLDDDQLKKACSITRTRRGGPGGQHRNKVETAIVITHDASGISAQAGEQRSQHANLTSAIARLRINLAIGVRSDPLPTAPSDLWKSRVKNRRIAVSVSHADYPSVVATALDGLALHTITTSSPPANSWVYRPHSWSNSLRRPLRSSTTCSGSERRTTLGC